MKMRGFKVVRPTKDPEIFLSATTLGDVVTYLLEEERIRDKEDEGPFAVFKDHESAWDFVYRSNDNLSLFECEYEPSEEDCLWCVAPHTLGESFYKKTRAIEDCPLGTVFAESVKLLGNSFRKD